MTSSSPQTAVMGVSGYAGAELVRLLLRHPRLASTPPLLLGREDAAPVALSALHPHLAGLVPGNALTVEPFSWELLQSRGVDLVFLATPHEQSRSLVPQALHAGLRVIDLSGAWRLHDDRNRAVYGFSGDHSACAEATQIESVYGLPELHAEAIADARLVANPGCYATSIILALHPFAAAGSLNRARGIVCDAKSGVSGAGKAPSSRTHFMHVADNLSAYGLFSHRHTGELLEQLHLSPEEIIFTPHLLPIPRGILSTIYLTFNERTIPAAVASCIEGAYAGRSLVRIYRTPELPQIAHSVHTSFADIGFHLAPDGCRCILVSCLDNLLKGAAGQAVQNMNIMRGWPEAEGLL